MSKSLRVKTELREWAGMPFQAVRPENPKEHGPMIVLQDGGTSSLFASAVHEHSRGRPGTEVSNVQKRDR